MVEEVVKNDCTPVAGANMGVIAPFGLPEQEILCDDTTVNGYNLGCLPISRLP